MEGISEYIIEQTNTRVWSTRHHRKVNKQRKDKHMNQPTKKVFLKK